MPEFSNVIAAKHTIHYRCHHILSAPCPCLLSNCKHSIIQGTHAQMNTKTGASTNLGEPVWDGKGLLNYNPDINLSSVSTSMDVASKGSLAQPPCAGLLQRSQCRHRRLSQSLCNAFGRGGGGEKGGGFVGQTWVAQAGRGMWVERRALRTMVGIKSVL
eukprot:1159934-Pelagomonas_calceolata.AAC.2